MSASPGAVVAAIAAGRKATQLYPVAHPAFVEAIDALVAATGSSTADGPFVLNLYQGRLYHESSVLPADVPGVRAIAEAFESRGLESLSIHPGFSRDDAILLVEVLGLRPGPDLDIETELKSRGVSTVSVAFLADEGEDRAERERQREQDRALYRRLTGAIGVMATHVSDGELPDLGVAESVVAGILARLADDPAAVMGLATLQDTGERGLFHSVNVMIHTLTLGREIGLPEEGLSLLGSAALTHDIGKTAFNASEPAQSEAMHLAHPAVGAEILGSLPDEDRTPMLVAYEHHMHVDGSGFPERAADYVPHPFSRMVAIANRYDNLVHPHAGEPLTPDRAIVQILREAGALHDPMYARLFARAMGAFPVGSLVRLNDHAVAVVSKPGEDVLEPVVRVLWDSAGMRVAEPFEEALAASGRAIVEVVDPDSLDTNVSEHL